LDWLSVWEIRGLRNPVEVPDQQASLTRRQDRSHQYNAGYRSRSLDRYAQRNEDSVLVTHWTLGDFKTDGIHELVEIVNDALIEAVELRALLLLQFLVSGDRR
jgi:hypothetical protein